MSGDIKLGGKLFSFVNYAAITSLNEHYVMKWMRETGLDRVLPKVSGETDEQYMARLHAAVIDTLRVHELLAGYLLPAGKGEGDWTLAMAAETTRYLQGLQTQDDKAAINSLVLDLVLDFFRQGLDLFKASQSYLNQAEKMNSPTRNDSKIAAH